MISKFLENQIKSDIAYYDRAISLHPKHTETYYLRGFVNYKLGRYKGTITDYEQVIGLNPEYKEVYYILGFAKIRLLHKPDAIKDLVRAVKLNPDPEHAEDYYVRGVANGILGRHKASIADFDQAISLRPEYERDYYVRLSGFREKNKRQSSSHKGVNHIHSGWRPVPGMVERRVVEFYNKGEYIYEIKEKEREEAKRRQEKARIRQEENLKREKAIDQVKEKFEQDFLQADLFYEKHLSSILPKDRYEKEKIEFVQEWMSENVSFLPDEDQARAISEIHGNIQLVARAGSGKTSTLVNRALFIIKHCRVPAEELLLLAFNRKAVLEMRKRMLFTLNNHAEDEFETQMKREVEDSKRWKNASKTQDIEEKIIDMVAEKLGIWLPHVMTFHALAYAIVKPEENLIYDDPQSDILGLSYALQQVINEHIIGDLQSEIRDLMLAHFENHWEAILRGGYEKDKDEFLKFRRSLRNHTLKGEFVKSTGEKLIADFLFEHDIIYRYQRSHWWNGEDYCPDFTVNKNEKVGVIVEHFGLEGDEDYDRQAQKKRNYWNAKEGWELIELSPLDLSADGSKGFREKLKNSLQQKGIQCVKLSEDEIWHRIYKRAIDRFTRTTTGFVNRCRQLSWTKENLKDRISEYLNMDKVAEETTEDLEVNGASQPSLIEERFLLIIQRIYSAYLERLSATKEEDFNGLMQRAVDMIKRGHTRLTRRNLPCDLANIRYMFIDEFQDFSDLFYQVVLAVKELNEEMELFCVGDDWQAINRFAGSDLIFFEKFDQCFDNSNRFYMTTNYRSKRSIVEVSNVLMNNLGEPARPVYGKDSGYLLVADLHKLELSPLEKEYHGHDSITPAVLRLTERSLKEDRDVVLLSRRNEILGFVNNKEEKHNAFEEHVRSYFPQEQKERISVSTVHKYKGLEKKTVIILDAVEGRYPLIHMDWIFTRIFGDDISKIIRDEQRLFYVAMTRAIDELIIITRGAEKSPFLEDLISTTGELISDVSWDNFPPLVLKGQEIYLVKVGNLKAGNSTPTRSIKGLLKESGYSWNPKQRTWTKSFPVNNFSLEILELEKWSRIADGVQVQVFDETDANCLAFYAVESGQWRCKYDYLDKNNT